MEQILSFLFLISYSWILGLPKRNNKQLRLANSPNTAGIMILLGKRVRLIATFQSRREP